MTRVWLRWMSIAVVMGLVLSMFKSWFSDVGLGVWGSAFALLLGALFSGLFSRNLSSLIIKEGLGLKHSYLEKVFLFFVVFMSGLSFTALWGIHQGQWGVTNPDNLGDFPFHMHLMNFFARGASFPFQNPIFAGSRLSYPFGVDYWDSLWMRVGVPMGVSLVVTGLVSLWITATQLTRMGGLLLLVAFFWSGGMATGGTWQQTFGPESPLAWKSLYHAVFVTQRGFLFALPAGLLMIREWQDCLDQEKRGLSRTTLWLWAVMPVFHLHTFAILSFWMGLTALVHRKIDLRWIFVGVSTLLWLWMLSATGKAQDAIGFMPGWMMKNTTDWVNNFGPWLGIPLGLVWKWVQDRKWKDLLVALVLVGFVLLVRLAPWDWDQIKVLIWVYLLLTFWWIREWDFGFLARSALLGLIFWPGLIHWVSGWPSKTGIFGVQPAAHKTQIEFLLKDVPVESRVLARVDHRHPLYGSGQLLYLGFTGHVWSHGLNPDERNKVVESLVRKDSPRLDFKGDQGFDWILIQDSPIDQEGSSPEVYQQFGFGLHRKVGKWELWRKNN